MKWVTLLLQLASLRTSFLESSAMMESARAAAEKGKRAAVFSGFVFFAMVYFLTGSIVLIIELGSQWDRAGRLFFSGIVFASFFCFFLAASLVGIGALVTAKERLAPEPEKASDLKVALEEVAVGFLKQLAKKMKEGE
jgi:hypothetical protein